MLSPYSISRNLPRAIFISIPLVTFVYVFANIAYVTAMSPQELLASNAVAVVSGFEGGPDVILAERLPLVGHLRQCTSLLQQHETWKVHPLMQTSVLTFLRHSARSC